MRVLALDPSAVFGFCHGEHDDVSSAIHGTFRLPKTSEQMTPSRRAVALRDWLREIIRYSRVQRVVLEKPILPEKTSFDAVVTLAGYAFVVGMVCVDEGVKFSLVDMQTWRSEFGSITQAPRKQKGTGHTYTPTERRALVKQSCLSRCKALGFDPKDDNAADAIGLWWSVTERIRRRDAQPMLAFDEAAGLSL